MKSIGFVRHPRRLCLMLLGVVLADVPDARGGEPVTVDLKSGRTYTAHVDEQTDEGQLYLRFEGNHSTIWRPIDWDQMKGGRYEGRDVTVDELRRLAERIKSKSTRLGAFPPAAKTSTALPAEPSGAAVELSRVQALSIEAYVANWDADVEVDGVVVRAFPIDEYGQIVSVDGTLEVELIGTRPAALRGEFSHSRGEPFPRLGSWKEAFAASDVTPAGIRLRLPFQAAHPQFDYRLGALGIVHARLIVPGQGVFEDSADLVRIRPYSPTRDKLQQLEGRRFFAGERTGRSR